MRTLIIVESPAKAKTISKYLGPDYIIRSTYGHIIDLPSKTLAIDIPNGFAPKYSVIPDKIDKVKAIVDAAKSCDEIIIASDPDREGEAIAWHVNNELKHLGKPTVRATFHEISEKAIKKEIKNAKAIDENMVQAQQARRVIDRLVGYMVSPYVSKKMGESLSAGRVQSVAVRLINDLEDKINGFIPDIYYLIDISLSKSKSEPSFYAKYKAKVTTEEQAKKVKEDLTKAQYKIVSIISETKTRNPFPPLTTSKLQQEAYAKFKMPTDRTMKAAQDLYEAGHVTYIRSDSTRSSDDSIAEVREYLKNNNLPIPNTPNIYKNKDSSQDAHEAIRPTHVEMLPAKISVEDDQKKIYDLIWTMFVSSQMAPALFDVVDINIVTDNGHELTAEGSIQRQAGWMSVCESYLKKTKDVTLPILNKNDDLILASPIKTTQKKTSPPTRLNDGTLVEELEKRGIGRPSTFATIVSKIASKKYVIKTAKGFEPTALGKRITQILKEHFSFMDFKYTAQMEDKLSDIADGKLTYLAFMTDFFDSFKVEFQKARGSEGLDAGVACPKCGDKTVVRKSPFGFFAGCVKYPECKGIVNVNIDNGKVVQKISKPIADESIKCPECDSLMHFRSDGKFGPYYSCTKYPRCYGKRKALYDKTCPKCNKNQMYITFFHGQMKLACSGYPDCKTIEDMPEGVEVNWVNPDSITPPVFAAGIEKTLKKKVKEESEIIVKEIPKITKNIPKKKLNP